MNTNEYTQSPPLNLANIMRDRLRIATDTRLAIKKLVRSIEAATDNGESKITVVVPGGYNNDVVEYLEREGFRVSHTTHNDTYTISWKEVSMGDNTGDVRVINVSDFDMETKVKPALNLLNNVGGFEDTHQMRRRKLSLIKMTDALHVIHCGHDDTDASADLCVVSLVDGRWQYISLYRVRWATGNDINDYVYPIKINSKILVLAASINITSTGRYCIYGSDVNSIAAAVKVDDDGTITAAELDEIG